MNKLFTKYRNIIVYFHDLFVTFIAWLFAFLLRFNFDVPLDYIQLMWNLLPIIILLQATTFFLSEIYRSLWMFSSVLDLKRIIYCALLLPAMFLLLRIFPDLGVIIPYSIIILYPLILIILLSMSRLMVRLYKEKRLTFFGKKNVGEPLVIIGAGAATNAIVKELSFNNNFYVAGILDNKPSLTHREIQGVRILGTINYLADAVKLFDLKQVIILIPETKPLERKQATNLAADLKLKILIMPSADEIIQGKLIFSRLKHVEVADLLGRNIINLNTQLLRQEIKGKRILISGAGGSIGSELCRQLLIIKPKIIVCVDISEYAIYQLEQSLSNQSHSTDLYFILADIKNSALIDGLFGQYKPDIVFHAAAYKHVPLIENDNVAAGFTNNVVGTYRLADAAIRAGVKKFVLVSTDKAVKPVNIMGATKRLAEMVCEGLQNKKNNKTNFIVVRFGNVLESSGSVIPKFRSQIASGGPITVTHQDITRFFMALPEAAQLVLQASAMGKGGEILVLDMGQPIKIIDLAKSMINLSGANESDIKIKITGLRPGEKLYEEILIDGEDILPTRHKKIFIAKTKSVSMAWLNSLMVWVESIPRKQESVIKRELKKWVVEYKQTSK
jgi:FlaA1/EpsC-like NDP-sugar epimerase